MLASDGLGRAPLFKTADMCDKRCILSDITNMSSRAPDMLGSVFSTGRPPAASAFPPGAIPIKVRAPGEAPAGEFTPPVAKRRTAIYDMHHSVHCSIIGTCLSSAELRRLMIKSASTAPTAPATTICTSRAWHSLAGRMAAAS
jgi:hypothetical protein